MEEARKEDWGEGVVWPRPGNWGSRKAAAEAGVEGHGKDARRTQGRGKVKGEGQRGGTEVKSERARWRGRERQVRKRERRRKNGKGEPSGDGGGVLFVERACGWGQLLAARRLVRRGAHQTLSLVSIPWTAHVRVVVAYAVVEEGPL